MKRPFAVFGFSMLFSTLVFYNISFKAALVLTAFAVIIFLLLLSFKKLRELKTPLFALASVIAFSVSFVICQYQYITAERNMGETVEIRGVVCQTPTHSDCAHTYIIKLENRNYKVRYVAEDNRFFAQGDVVSGTLMYNSSVYEDADFLDSSLSSKIYFTFFEDDELRLIRTGEVNAAHKAVGEIKNAFTAVTYSYIPGENADIANAMAIGDRSGISQQTTEQFNYAGSSHLLVVSGLHLSLWAFGVLKLLGKSAITRKYTVPISLTVLVAYSALTGFSVSVLRAGAMVGAVIIGKLLRRDADSLNSIGVGITGILLVNPYSAQSVSLWFTVLSTAGILVLQKPLEKWIFKTYIGIRLGKTKIFKFLVSASTVSISATICTLPVFVIAFEFLPWASVLSNILMVDAAMVVMVTTVIGAFFHFLHLYPFAQLAYWVSGTLSGFLRFCAETIGVAEWSGLPMSNVYYKVFIVTMAFCIALAYIFRNRIPDIRKFIAVALSTAFILLSLVSVIYDYNTPSIELIKNKSTPLIHINYKGESVLIGCEDKTSTQWVNEVMNAHGQKSPEMLIVTDENELTISNILNYQQTFQFTDVCFCEDGFSLFEGSENNINIFSLGEDLEISFYNYQNYLEFSYKNKNIICIYGEAEENLFKKSKVYDTIITYDDLSVPEGCELIKVKSGETVSLYF